VRARTTRRLAWGLWVLSIGSLLTVSAYGLAGRPTAALVDDAGGVADWIATAMFIVTFATVGALVASRRPGNPIGWLLSVSALCYALATASIFIAAQPWGERLATWMGNWIWGLGLALPISFVLLLFPDGHLTSPRWRPVAWLAGITIGAFVVGSVFAPGLLADSEPPTINPIGFGGAIGHAVFGSMRTFGLVLLPLLVPFAIASLVFRYRRADGSEREQLRWLIFACVIVGVGSLANGFVGRFVSDPNTANDISNAIISIAAAALPIAIGIAILRNGLYDIDVVLNKTVVYGALAAFITLVYVAIVVGLGSLVGRGGEPNVPLSILATALVAIAFQPVRERVQRFANRLVYGKRATPYEVLSTFSGQMGDTYASDDLLPKMAQILAEGTGAKQADVWLNVDGELRVEAAWPPRELVPPPISADRTPEDMVTVRHQGEMLGAFIVEKQPGETLTHNERALVEDLASQAGLVLRNVGLTEQLRARLEELRASRERIVTAQDAERRRLERNIHDGAQQQLVALAVKLKLADATLDRDAAKASQMLADLQADTADALENLRDLARGIYPPLLADQGLVAALEAQARKAAVPTTVEGNGLGRFDQDVEAAVYFSCLEALQNTAKYADASRATIALSNGDGSLTFTVSDDGAGFDTSETSYGTGLQGIADRLAALGGTLDVRSEPGAGTTVAGHLPAEAQS